MCAVSRCSIGPVITSCNFQSNYEKAPLMWMGDTIPFWTSRAKPPSGLVQKRMKPNCHQPTPAHLHCLLQSGAFILSIFLSISSLSAQTNLVIITTEQKLSQGFFINHILEAESKSSPICSCINTHFTAIYLVFSNNFLSSFTQPFPQSLSGFIGVSSRFSCILLYFLFLCPPLF